MNWNLYHASLTMNPNHIRYDIYSFIKLTANYFGISKFHEECMIFRFHQTWSLQSDLYAKTKYEDVVICILLFTNEYDCKNGLINVESYVLSLYKRDEYEKHITAIYKVLQTLKTINNCE